MSQIENAVAERREQHADAIRLNIGAGGSTIPGYLSLDIKTGTDCKTLPYPDNSVDEVYASHVLEHFDYWDTPKVLAEWSRVLKPGGIMRIAVPDIEKITRDRTIYNSGWLDRQIIGGLIDKNDRHGAVFDEARLRVLMYNCGLGWVDDFEPFADDTSKESHSLCMMGRKRWWPKIENPSGTLVLSQPRICFTDHMERLIHLAHNMRFSISRVSGAFWDRDIELAIENVMKQESRPDFLLFSDYDSVFDPADVSTLIHTLNSTPDAAAIGAVQMSRHDNRPLVFDPSNTNYNQDVSQVRFQHFGLTVIRTEVFDELPKPWFWSIPGQNKKTGELEWGAYGRSDADITFWRILWEHGFKVLQHNGVVIGHMVMSVKWPRPDGSGTMLQPIEMYNRHGKPKNAKFDPTVYMSQPDVYTSMYKEGCIDPEYLWVNAQASGWQFGETGMLYAVAKKACGASGVVVECGAGDGVKHKLTCEKLVADGWTGVLIDGNPSDVESLSAHVASSGLNAKVVHAMIRPPGHGQTIDDVLSDAGVAGVDAMVLDVDSFEWHVLDGMKMRPKIVMVEHFDLAGDEPPKEVPQVGEAGKMEMTKGGFAVQATWQQLRSMMVKTGYTMIGMTRTNSLYARNDVCGELRA